VIQKKGNLIKVARQSARVLIEVISLFQTPKSFFGLLCWEIRYVTEKSKLKNLNVTIINEHQ